MKATIEDLSALSALEKACFPDPWSPHSLADILADEKYLVLLHHDENGEPLGYLIGSHLFDEAELARIAVLPHGRGQGLGRLILETALDEWWQSGVEQVFLEVRASNIIARQLYISSGFEIIATRKGYYEDAEDALILKRERIPAPKQ